MTLSDLTAYAKTKYDIREIPAAEVFPGCTELDDPKTHKWIAILIREKNPDGSVRQKCDFRCGQEVLILQQKTRPAWLSGPFRMKGKQWVGVTLDERTDRDAVYRLFDKAVGFYRDEPAAVRRVAEEELRSAPRKIIEMMELYQPEGETGAEGDAVTSLEKQQSEYRNFCRQGKFMEGFEDDWDQTGNCRTKFVTYHDMTLGQLREYFTWRTQLWKGKYRNSEDYIDRLYVRELACGIGAESPADRFRMMEAFEKTAKAGGKKTKALFTWLHGEMLGTAVFYE